MSTPCMPPPATAGHFAPCPECEGDGFVFIATQWWGDEEQPCPECHGAKEVWIRTAPRDTTPAPAPEMEAAE